MSDTSESPASPPSDAGVASTAPATSDDAGLTSDAPTDAPTPSANPSREPFLERLSDALQHGIKVLVGSNRSSPRLVKSLLSGTYLGHPLHPVVTDIPIGAWLLAAVFDIIWLFAPGASVWAARGAQALVLAGLVGALLAILSGSSDWSDTYGHERRVGLLHGTLNTAATIIYLISAALRFGVSSHGLDLAPGAAASTAGAIVGFVGLALVIVAAYLGGDLVFTNATGVNHTHFEPVVEQFVPVGPLADVPQNALYRVMADGAPVLLVRMGDSIAAIGATCSHDGGPLHEGQLVSHGKAVQCPWHGSRFRLRSGRVLTGPATANVPRYDVRIREGQVEVKRR